MNNWNQIKTDVGVGVDGGDDGIFLNITNKVGCLVWERVVDMIGVSVWHQTKVQVCDNIARESRFGDKDE